MTALAIQKKAEILAGIAEGKRLSELNLGITRQSISQALHDDPEYQAALEAGHAARLDRAEKMIEGAAEQTDVARARALWSAVSWRAEREAARLWGAKQQVTHTHTHTADGALADAAADLLCAVRESKTPRLLTDDSVVDVQHSV